MTMRIEEVGPTVRLPSYRYFVGFFNVPSQGSTRGHSFLVHCFILFCDHFSLLQHWSNWWLYNKERFRCERWTKLVGAWLFLVFSNGPSPPTRHHISCYSEAIHTNLYTYFQENAPFPSPFTTRMGIRRFILVLNPSSPHGSRMEVVYIQQYPCYPHWINFKFWLLSS